MSGIVTALVCGTRAILPLHDGTATQSPQIELRRAATRVAKLLPQVMAQLDNGIGQILMAAFGPKPTFTQLSDNGGYEPTFPISALQRTSAFMLPVDWLDWTLSQAAFGERGHLTKMPRIGRGSRIFACAQTLAWRWPSPSSPCRSHPL